MSEETQKAYELLSGNAAAEKAIDTVIARATKRILIFEHDMQERGYNSPGRLAALSAFLLASRANQLRIVVHETAGFESHCPRLILLLRQFSGSIQIHRSVGMAREAKDPLVIADEVHFWHKLHYQHPRSVLTLDSALDTKPLIDRFEEIWESSEQGVSATTSGL